MSLASDLAVGRGAPGSGQVWPGWLGIGLDHRPDLHVRLTLASGAAALDGGFGGAAVMVSAGWRESRPP